MSVRIPVYEHTFGDGLSILKATDKRVIAEPDAQIITELVGYIIAPDTTIPWETANGIDILTKADGSAVSSKSFDLPVAIYYAEKNMHNMTWEPNVCTVVAVDDNNPDANNG